MMDLDHRSFQVQLEACEAELEALEDENAALAENVKSITAHIDTALRERDALAERVQQAESDNARLLDFIVSMKGWTSFPTKESSTSALEVMELYRRIEPMAKRHQEAARAAIAEGGAS